MFSEALQTSVVEGAGGAIPPWVANGRNRATGQELLPGEAEMHAYLFREAKPCE